MIYKNIKKGIFKERPNRFVAHVEIDGKTEICHVKNTGRCKELLVEGAVVYLQEFDCVNRKTKYDLISVEKNNSIVNIDSQAPNKVFYEWLQNTDYFGTITLIKPESKYKNSRFDFYIETENKKIYIETKGVTLEENSVARFPDAPTERGVKHLNELIDSVENGYDAYVFFIVQMENITHFEPNKHTHKEFADVLKLAESKGVKIKCLDCNVEFDKLTIDKFIKTEI